MRSNNYKDLIVWQKSVELVAEIYHFTETFPSTEKFGLVSQMRRSAISIPSNIAEGSKRGTKKDFCQFLVIAFGSGAELETQIEISKRLSLSKGQNYHTAESLLEEIMRMLNKTIQVMRSAAKN